MKFACVTPPQLISGVLDSMPEAIAVLDRHGNVIASNEAWKSSATARNAAGIAQVGSNFLNACSAAAEKKHAFEAHVLAAVQAVLSGMQDRSAVDYESVDPKQWFKLSTLSLSEADGAIIIHANITESKEREEALRRSEHRLRLLTDSLPVLISYVDRHQRYRFNNKSYELWFGHPREYVQGKHLAEVLGENAYQTIRPRVEAALSGEQVIFEEFIPYSGAGQRYVRAAYVPDRQNGQIQGFFALIHDLTERKQAEEEIRESRDQLSTIITGADIGTWDWDIPAGTVDVNDRYCTMLGYEPGRFGRDAHRFFESVHPDDIANLQEELAAHFSGANPFFRCDFRLRMTEGSYRWIHGAGRLVDRGPPGEPQRMVGIHIDINDRKLADEALKEREEEFRSMFELAAAGNAQADPATGRFIRVNRKFCEITGYTETDLLQMTYRDITHPDDRAEDTADIQKVIAGERKMWSREKRYLRKDGSIVWVAVNGTALRIHGSVQCTVANIVDITERKTYETLLRAQREALRNLAAEITQTQEKERRRIADDLHDQIGQNLALAKMKLGEIKALIQGPEATAIEQVRTLIDHSLKDTRSLVRELSPQVLYELGLEAALEWLVEQTQARYGLRCRAQTMPLRAPVQEKIRGVLFQAARELLVNVAKHAQATEAMVLLKQDARGISIEVRDDGCGFEPSGLSLPSSTIRGFGLFSVAERAALLGGELHIDSTPRSGTRVMVSIPT